MVWNIQDKMRKKITRSKRSPVLFIYTQHPSGPHIAGLETAASSIIALSGGINPIQDHKGYRPIQAQTIIAAQPEYILLTTDGMKSLGGKDSVLRLPGIAKTPAGKNQQIIVMDDLFLLGFGPRIADAILDLSAQLQ